MYGTVSEICIELLKKHENHERMAVITWIVEDVYEMGAEYNPTAADVANLKGEALSEALSYTSTDGAGGSIAVGGYVSYVTGDTEDSVKLVAGDWTSMGSLTGTDGAYNVYQAADAGRYLLVQQKLNIQNA